MESVAVTRRHQWCLLRKHMYIDFRDTYVCTGTERSPEKCPSVTVKLELLVEVSMLVKVGEWSVGRESKVVASARGGSSLLEKSKKSSTVKWSVTAALALEGGVLSEGN